MNNTIRKIRQILTNKWILCIYLIFITVLFISYMHCKFSPVQTSQQNTNEHQKRTTNSVGFVKTIDCYLFLFIMASPTGFTRRKAIRETWLKKKRFNNLQVEWRFIIGSKDLHSITLKELQVEQNKNSDLLFINDHKDSYNDLTSKLLKTMVWIASNVKSKYVMKADDDTFVRLDILFEDMQKHEHKERIYWGYFRGNSNVKRIGQWAEKSWFLSNHYLPYALGGGYILTLDLVQYVSRVSDMLQMYNSEDVSLGVWLAPVQLNRIHDIRFDTEYKSRGCSNEHVVSHKQNEENMYDKHDQLQLNNRLCKVEKEILYAFDYDWNVSPSECCKRISRLELKKKKT